MTLKIDLITNTYFRKHLPYFNLTNDLYIIQSNIPFSKKIFLDESSGNFCGPLNRTHYPRPES